ncbi:MAG: DUF2061 domain-containing protein [Candidatus Omnitrophica bacterium]|nr:DUF2061 domain-containing protein [Candidatus Omnitrophota bacterium]MDE2009624.1 DUF2061 domain-containing protein [Candidatus Omnitrophota bacterium]MDE2214448.1 DUF2061 domain-containing protein [Candidatus Omnitrophota bacterium]MDE2231588.1 DUF2061 domain-containing protein [Candidatus Omnitrophota bacterium]
MAPLTVKDKHWRSVAKSVSWRLTGTIDTIIISWLITHRLQIALTIGSIELFTKMVLYYLHERAWEKVKIGRTVVDYEI